MSSRTIRLAVVGGDGLRPEVTAEALKVLGAATPGRSISDTSDDVGARRWHRTGETLPDAVLEEIRGHEAILLGAVGDPGVPSGVLERGLLLRLRCELAHYVNLRPVRLYPGVATPLAAARPETLDMVVVREGTEGPYTGAGGVMRKGTPAECATTRAAARPETLHMFAVREGTEGRYPGGGGVMRRGTPAEIATQESINT